MRERYVFLLLVLLGVILFIFGVLMIAYGLAIIGYPPTTPQHVVLVRDFLHTM